MRPSAVHDLLQQGAGASTSACFTILLSLVVLLATIWLHRRWRSQDLLRIPKPWGDLPVLGHVVQMALHVDNGHEQFLKWHEAYGKIVRIRLLHRDIVLVADPKAAADVLSKGPNECSRRTPEYKTFDVVSSRVVQHNKDSPRLEQTGRQICQRVCCFKYQA